jgi:hypothetical protein
MVHMTPEKAEEWVEKIGELFVLKREVFKGVQPLIDFMVPPSAPMPIPYPADGMTPPVGWAYAVLCIEGAGWGTVFFQKDSKGAFSHAWFEAHYSDGTREAVSHNINGFSSGDLNENGPKILRVAYLFPEEAVKTAYSLAQNYTGTCKYSVRCENCLDTVKVATNSLGIPLPPHTTPTHGVATPEWVYQYFLNSPYYAPYAYRKSKLLDAFMFYKDISKSWVLDESLQPPQMKPSLSLGEQINTQTLFPSKINQNRYGGIALNKKAELKVHSGNINGAFFDPLTGQLILVGQKKLLLPEMPIDDLAVAFKSIYGLGGIPPADPAVSIEPSSEKGKMSVIYSGQTFGSQFGLRLFEADLVLKGLVLGSLNSQTPGYKSLTLRLENNRINEAGNAIALGSCQKLSNSLSQKMVIQ